MSGLTKELQKLGFYCGIELIIYIQDTGVYTSLIIEGENYQDSINYDFYKQTFYPHYLNRITIYGEHLSPAQLIERVEIYLTNREKFIEERNSNL
ncbi:hypothetical protein K9128_000460 [Listeria monocytogenes]|uniref:hypothetical protein n=1 Tax=Listeria monocytogenes TaxID=1639 RepID=UPI0013AAA50E|nr:hypothetical protein [Listeria monocytogenes]EAG8233298.1 hypothetical protein [Listeria monocytogenes]EAG8239213.1 hypothetical protein [Listeria monocytogenes]EAH0155667.1 hypothetical protein [Listeria monocytogenes]EAH1644377.1 hypothetical protein [Listeria monocytogenes]EAH3095596.1 hypothetical protein [Listeria monocytogenes]